jgi:hypothetical protein
VRRIDQQPCEELIYDQRKVCAQRGRFEELPREQLRLGVRQAFENSILQVCERSRDTELVFVTGMFRAVNRAADRAAFAVLPVEALADLVRSFVRSNAQQILILDQLITMESKHVGLLKLRRSCG